MQDVIYIGIVVVFFALMALFTTACERIIGSDEDNLFLDEDDEVATEQVAA